VRTYLVDVTNAVRRGDYDHRFPEMEEARCRGFVERLATLAGGAGFMLELVFDGPRRPVGPVGGAVRLRFSGERQADDLILGTVRALRAQGRGAVVATEDGALRREVEEEGARVIGFGELVDRLQRGHA